MNYQIQTRGCGKQCKEDRPSESPSDQRSIKYQGNGILKSPQYVHEAL